MFAKSIWYINVFELFFDFWMGSLFLLINPRWLCYLTATPILTLAARSHLYHFKRDLTKKHTNFIDYSFLVLLIILTFYLSYVLFIYFQLFNNLIVSRYFYRTIMILMGIWVCRLLIFFYEVIFRAQLNNDLVLFVNLCFVFLVWLDSSVVSQKILADLEYPLENEWVVAYVMVMVWLNYSNIDYFKQPTAVLVTIYFNFLTTYFFFAGVFFTSFVWTETSNVILIAHTYIVFIYFMIWWLIYCKRYVNNIDRLLFGPIDNSKDHKDR